MSRAPRVEERNTAIAHMSVARRALMRASTAPQVREIIAIGAAALTYAKQKKLGNECIDEALRLKNDAMRKIDRILKATPKSVGGEHTHHHPTGGKFPPVWSPDTYTWSFHSSLRSDLA